MDQETRDLIDANNKLLENKLSTTQKGVDDAIKRFERSYGVILKENEKTNNKLDLILSQHVGYTKDIALNSHDIEAGKQSIGHLSNKIDGMDDTLKDVTSKLGGIPLKVGTAFLIIVAIAGAALRFLPNKNIEVQKVKNVQ